MIRSILVLVLCLFTASASFAAHETAVVSASLELEGASTSTSATFFTAALDGAQEVPVVKTDGKGTGAFRLDDEGLHYTITVSELSGDITNAHFHRAAAGISGGVVHGINSTFSGNTAQGVWLTEDTLTGELIGALLAGELYINIHTAENGGGEIRGQVLVAGGVGLWADLTAARQSPARADRGPGPPR